MDEIIMDVNNCAEVVEDNTSELVLKVKDIKDELSEQDKTLIIATFNDAIEELVHIFKS